jgi:tripartite ATP-independent transporter DctM subunit
MIIYGAVVGASITALFSAGFIPGLVLVVAFMAVILVWSLLVPTRVGEANMVQPLRQGDVGRILLFFGLIVAVLGSIYAGLATPTEAGAIGALGGLLICGVMGRLTMQVVRECVLETLQVTALLMLVVCFAAVVTYVIDFTRMPRIIVDLLTPVIERPVLLFIGICFVYLVLGTFMEPVSMMLVTLPIVFPLVTAAHFDPVWFGIVLVLLMEIGLLTPPIGMNLFVIKAIVPDAKLQDIVVGVLPFIAAMVLLLAALYAWPDIALWLPARMR